MLKTCVSCINVYRLFNVCTFFFSKMCVPYKCLSFRCCMAQTYKRMACCKCLLFVTVSPQKCVSCSDVWSLYLCRHKHICVLYKCLLFVFVSSANLCILYECLSFVFVSSKTCLSCINVCLFEVVVTITCVLYKCLLFVFVSLANLCILYI